MIYMTSQCPSLYAITDFLTTTFTAGLLSRNSRIPVANMVATLVESCGGAVLGDGADVGVRIGDVLGGKVEVVEVMYQCRILGRTCCSRKTVSAHRRY